MTIFDLYVSIAHYLPYSVAQYVPLVSSRKQVRNNPIVIFVCIFVLGHIYDAVSFASKWVNVNEGSI